MYTNLSNEAQFILGNTGHLKRRESTFYGYLWQFMFDNGFGISIVKNTIPCDRYKDLWEIAVLDKNGEPCYDTPITDTVICNLTEKEVLDYAKQISRLNKTDCLLFAYRQKYKLYD